MASMGVLIQHHFLGLEATSRLVPCAKLSHHILVGLCLPVVRGGEGTKPQYGERVSEHCPHVHPLSFFSPSSLFLFQLLYALKMRDNQTSVEGPFVTQSVIINQNQNNPRPCRIGFTDSPASSLHVSRSMNLNPELQTKRRKRKRQMARTRPGTHQAAGQVWTHLQQSYLMPQIGSKQKETSEVQRKWNEEVERLTWGQSLNDWRTIWASCGR